MSKLRVPSFSISIDEFGSVPHQNFRNPLEVGRMKVFLTGLPTHACQRIHGNEDGEPDVDDDFAARPGKYADREDGLNRDAGQSPPSRSGYCPVRATWLKGQMSGKVGEMSRPNIRQSLCSPITLRALSHDPSRYGGVVP